MKLYLTLYSILFFSIISLYSQKTNRYNFDVSKENPYGKYNPKAPKKLQDFKQLIGECNCISESRNPDGSWAKPIKMIWRWKYIMNGFAIQDITLKEDGKHSGSIRQYDTINKQWNVHYFSTSATPKTLSSWTGNKKEDGNIVLYKDQKAPNGTEGFFRLTFYDISKRGYKWVGEWTDKTEKIIYPTWKISCSRKK